MTLREPLVIISGQIQQLPSGDTINGASQGSDTSRTVVTNNQGSTLNKCMAVYVDTADTVKLASGNSATTSRFVGFVAESIGTGNTGNIQVNGVLTATTGEWDAVAGTTGGLVANTVYYLAPATSGNITATPPSTVNQYVLPVGLGINSTDILIYQRPSILL